MTEPDKSVKMGWLKPLSKVIVPVCAVLVAVFSYLKGCQTSLKPMESTSVFMGVIRQKATHTPIPGAHIQIALNQRISKMQLSDSEGMFHVDVPQDAKSMTITVTLDGYEPLDRDADPHRSMLEILELSRSAVDDLKPRRDHAIPKREAFRSPTNGPDVSTNKTEVRPPNKPSSDHVTSSEGSQTICGPGVFNCNLAPNTGDQSIHVDQSTHVNEQKPPPNATFYQEKLSEDGSLVSIVIEVDRAFDDPAFDISCESPCESVNNAYLGRRDSSKQFFREAQTEISRKATPDMLHHRVAFSDRLPAGSYIKLNFRALSKSPTKILTVKSFIER